MLILFVVVALSAIGFGLVIPSFLFYAENLGASPQVATAIVASYSLGQFIGTPIWGRLSDRYGRKPVLITSMLGAMVSYLLLAFASSLWLLAVARAFGGFMAGNFSAASAYVADITPPHQRAKGMGAIGAGTSIGFILGPAIGGVLGGENAASASLRLPGLAAATMAAITLIPIIFFLRESLTPEQREANVLERRPAGWTAIKHIWRRPGLTRLVLLGFFFIFAISMLHTILPLWANAKFDWGPREVGLIFTLIGLLVAVIQGGLIGPLTGWFGEHTIAAAGIVLMGVGMLTIAQSPSWVIMMIGLCCTGSGTALINTSVTSLVSLEAGHAERGLVLGVYQSAGWAGRTTGPPTTGLLFNQVSINAPMWLGAIIAIPCLWLVLGDRRRSRRRNLAG